MKKIVCFLLLSAFISASAGNLMLESSITASPTNAVSYFDTHTSADTWIKVDSIYVVAPASKTGSVSFATMRGSEYVTFATYATSNSLATASHAFLSSVSAPVSGRVRITVNQDGVTTNAWKYGLFFEDGR